MLKLLANENIQRLIVARLRERGHDVRWVLEEHRGISDPIVMHEAQLEGRVLLTWDKDFGELVYRQGGIATHGVIVLRIFNTRSQDDIARVIIPILEAHAQKWPGHFSVIDQHRVRIRPIPT